MPHRPPPPAQLPMTGPDGTDAFGYPRAEPDKVGFLTLLYARRFEQLDDYIGSLQASFEQDFHKEYWPWHAIAAFAVADPALTPILDQWVKRSPQSFGAHAARARHRVALAWQARGTDFEIKNKAKFAEWLNKAKPDFERAVQLRPRFLAAHAGLMVLLGAGGAPTKARRALLDEGIKACPECVSLRRVYLDYLEPRWGGSYAAMDAFIGETRPMVSRNGRLAELASVPLNDHCQRALVQNQLDAAVELCTRALNAAPHLWRALYLRAEAHMLRNHWGRALADMNRVLGVAPQDTAALRRRAIVLIQTKRWVQAARDILRARLLDPVNDDLRKVATDAVNGVRYQGDQAYKAQRDAEAIEAFRLGLKLAPGDPDLIKRLAFAQARGGMEQLRREVRANPNDFELHRQLDYALATKRKFHEIVKMWTDYIARNPNDARAYHERGGAYRNLRDRARMSKDVLRACDMGNQESCRIAKRLRLR